MKTILKSTLGYIGVPALIIAGVAATYLSGGKYVTTDNAYVKVGLVSIAAQTGGEVVEIHAIRNQPVKAGDLLLKLDDSMQLAKLEQAKANLVAKQYMASSIKDMYLMRHAELERAKEKLAFDERELARAIELAATSNLSEATLDERKYEVEKAKKGITIATQAQKMILNQLGGHPDLPIEKHVLVVEARALVKLAEVALDHTRVLARTDGIITNIDLHPGEFVRPGQSIFSMTRSGLMWVEANLKETDMTRVREGQPVTLIVDAFPDQEISGTVSTINPATGSEFALLPPQNATGNWVKVTKRIPVQVDLGTIPAGLPVRAGMSVEVTIDTGYERNLDTLLAEFGISG